MSNYSSNITEEIRLEIGRMLIAHETIKLFPSFGYVDVKRQVNEKWSDLDEDSKIRDFWNLLDALMMGYKLKDVVRLITTQNLAWKLRINCPVGDLRFTWDKKLGDLNLNGKSANEADQYLKNNRETFKKIKLETQNEYQTAGLRALDPIIVEQHTSGAFYVQDGNGRLLKAVVSDQDTLDAYLGVYGVVSKSNHWITTSYLQRLADSDCKKQLIDLLTSSDNAFVEFNSRVVIDSQVKQEVLYMYNRVEINKKNYGG